MIIRPLISRAVAAYTLIEVLAASSIIALSMAASVSLSSTLLLQEELSWRVAVVRNYQENMARLWQLGIATGTSRDTTVAALMPNTANNPVLNRILFTTPTIISVGQTNPNNLGTMSAAFVDASVNISTQGVDTIKAQGSSFTLTMYRPRMITDLRPAAP